MPDTVVNNVQDFDFSGMADLRRIADAQSAEDQSVDRSQQSADFVKEQRQKQRDELEEKVRFGEMTPDEAEKAIRKVKGEPFKRTPANLATFDATMERWSPEMTAIWISTLDPKAVHRHHARSHQNATAWVKNENRYSVKDSRRRGTFERSPAFGPDRHGYDLRPLHQTRLHTKFIDFDGQEQEFPPEEAWYPELQGYLSGGKISAIGLPIASYSRTMRIGRDNWPLARLDRSEGGDAVLKVDVHDLFRCVMFDASEILKHYPPKTALENRPTKVQRWKAGVTPIEKYKQHIAERLKAKHSTGFPVFSHHKLRDIHLREILSDMTSRWDANAQLKNANDAFRKAMDRLLEDLLEDEIVTISAGESWMREHVKF